MAEYTAKKSNRGGPESSLEEADKVMKFDDGLGLIFVRRVTMFSLSAGTIVLSRTFPRSSRHA
jgi:hypothetical protein